MAEADSETLALVYAGETSSDFLSVVMVGRGFLEEQVVLSANVGYLFFSDHSHGLANGTVVFPWRPPVFFRDGRVPRSHATEIPTYLLCIKTTNQCRDFVTSRKEVNGGEPGTGA